MRELSNMKVGNKVFYPAMGCGGTIVDKDPGGRKSIYVKWGNYGNTSTIARCDELAAHVSRFDLTCAKRGLVVFEDKSNA